jgi:hypothetical protein
MKEPSLPVVPELGVNVAPDSDELTPTFAALTGLPYVSLRVMVSTVPLFTTTVEGFANTTDLSAVGDAALMENCELFTDNVPDDAERARFAPVAVTVSPEKMARPATAEAVVVPPSDPAPPTRISDTDCVPEVSRAP